MFSITGSWQINVTTSQTNFFYMLLIANISLYHKHSHIHTHTHTHRTKAPVYVLLFSFEGLDRQCEIRAGF